METSIFALDPENTQHLSEYLVKGKSKSENDIEIIKVMLIVFLDYHDAVHKRRLLYD